MNTSCMNCECTVYAEFHVCNICHKNYCKSCTSLDEQGRVDMRDFYNECMRIFCMVRMVVTKIWHANMILRNLAPCIEFWLARDYIDLAYRRALSTGIKRMPREVYCIKCHNPDKILRLSNCRMMKHVAKKYGINFIDELIQYQIHYGINRTSQTIMAKCCMTGYARELQKHLDILTEDDYANQQANPERRTWTDRDQKHIRPKKQVWFRTLQDESELRGSGIALLPFNFGSQIE